jgi:hypothetical protein
VLSRNNDFEVIVATLTTEKEHLEQERVREMRELALEQAQKTAERKMQENLHIVEIGNVRKGLVLFKRTLRHSKVTKRLSKRESRLQVH